MSFLLGIFLVVGILSLLYYGVIVSYAGIGSAFAWFWLLLGIGCLIISLFLHYMIKHMIMIPRLWRIILLTIFCIGFGIFSFVEGTIIYYGNQKADPGMDYLIVLGAQVRGTRITKSLMERLDTAAKYLKANSETLAIVSGGQGQGEDITEAEAMKQYLIAKGISEDRIQKEEKSTNTNENILFSKELIGDQNSTVAVVTNSFHIFRATRIMKKQGFLKVQGVSAPSDARLLVNYYVREVLGVMKDKLMGNM